MNGIESSLGCHSASPAEQFGQHIVDWQVAQEICDEEGRHKGQRLLLKHLQEDFFPFCVPHGVFEHAPDIDQRWR